MVEWLENPVGTETRGPQEMTDRRDLQGPLVPQDNRESEVWSACLA